MLLERRPALAGMLQLARAFFGFAGRRGLLALGFLVLGGLAEGVSILLLVPILQMAASNGGNYAIALPFDDPTGLLAGGMAPLWLVLSLLVCLVAVQAAFNRLKSVYMARLLERFVSGLRIGLFEAVGKARWEIFGRSRTAEIGHVLTDSVDRVQGATYYLLMLLQSAVMIMLYAAVSVAISPPMALVALAAGGLTFLALRPMRNRASAFGKLLTASRQHQFGDISEFLGGMKVIKSLNVENVYFGRYRKALERLRRDSIAYVSASTAATALFQLANGAGLAAFVYVALVGFRLSLAEVMVMLFVFWRITPRFMELQTNAQQLLTELPAFERLRAVRRDFDAAREPDFPANAGQAPAVRREIALRDVSFSFEGSGQSVLDHVSLSLPAGKVSALIGPSGAGKSTIADLLLGLLEPAEGQLLVDGTPVAGAGRRAWRERVAYVPQEIFLLHDTIAANLRIAAPEASDERLWEALRMAQASGFVEEMPAGLETVVGERGIRLSGGERQRIALARALLRKPSLLILDEATSALDWQNQALIAKAIESLRGSMTVLTIAHRPSMIAFADWVVAIEQGRVVESGPYSSLKGDMRSRLSLMLSGEQSAA